APPANTIALARSTNSNSGVPWVSRNRTRVAAGIGVVWAGEDMEASVGSPLPLVILENGGSHPGGATMDRTRIAAACPLTGQPATGRRRAANRACCGSMMGIAI